MFSWVLIACFALAAASPTPSVSLIKDIDRLNARIVGGTDASVGEFPWQATLQRSSGSHFCGGSLITANHVMTAAHCYVSGTRVGLGALAYNNPEQLINMASFTAHSQYSSSTIDFDYGIITMERAATLGGNVQIIRLVAQGAEYTGTASVSGWGYDTRVGQSTPITLQKTDLPLMSNTVCQDRWSNRFTITSQMQCVGGEGLVSVCSGDSGGPLTVEDNGVTTLIGAASWAESTCNPSYPGGYAKLSVVRSWIDSVIATRSPSVSHIKDVDHSKTRIVGGSDAALGEFPWQATLKRSSGSHFCGGSLITANHVMTAAHCRVSLTTVGLGALDYRYPEQTITMATFTAHPSYNSNTFDYDFAVITLSSTAVLGGNVQTIPLVAQGAQFTGTASVSGWGYDTRVGQSTPFNMKKSNIPLMSDSECQSIWGSVITITDRIQCVGGDGIVSVCSGDSGGPMTVEVNGETTLIGAASWAESTCNPAYPGGYAKLSAVRSWIDGIIN